MKGATAAQSSLLNVLHAILILSVMTLFRWQLAESVQFQHSSFSDTDLGDITFVKEDYWYVGQDPSETDSVIWITPDPRQGTSNTWNMGRVVYKPIQFKNSTRHPRQGTSNTWNNMGRVVYKDPIQFKNSTSDLPNKVASFNTSFSFQIITPGSYNTDGQGMTFFIAGSEKAPNNSYQEGLGLVDNSVTTPDTASFFAVEFDTYASGYTEAEPSGSHIGIDINTLQSLQVIDTSPNSSSGFYPELYLYNNYTFTTWIEYTHSFNLIQVWMTSSSSQERPPLPCLELSYNLAGIFQDFMYVGFSASDYESYEGHALHSWSFTSEDLNSSRPPNPPAAAPTPNTSINPSTSERPIHRTRLLVPLAATFSALSAVAVLAIVFLCISRRRRMMSVNRTVNLVGLQNHNKQQLASTPVRYSYNELRRAALGFSDENKVGEGAYSTVYKATLADGSSIAIKKLKEGVRMEAEFSSEITIISSIRHRNLLELQGWCYEKGEAMLVYKYMSNGSLDSYLYGEKRGTLQSETRLRILAGVALALEYLHSGLGECVLHRDVKAANVLLTENFEPMLGDFGLARLIGHDEGAVTMTVAGTPGYVAPEVIYTGKATDKADVYSFGVVALEIACGRPAMDRTTMRPEEVQLANRVWLLHQRNQLIEAIDPSMRRDMPSGQMEHWRCVLLVALMCCSPSPQSRPSMRQVSQAIHGDALLLMQPLPSTRPLDPTTPNSPAAASAWFNSETVAISPVQVSGSTSSSTFG